MRPRAAHATHRRERPCSATGTSGHGDWVVLWYASANFDEDVWDDRHASTSVGRRSPITHRSVHSAHITASARRSLDWKSGILLEEVVRRGIRFVEAGEPTRVASNFVNGMLHLPAVVTS